MHGLRISHARRRALGNPGVTEDQVRNTDCVDDSLAEHRDGTEIGKIGRNPNQSARQLGGIRLGGGPSGNGADGVPLSKKLSGERRANPGTGAGYHCNAWVSLLGHPGTIASERATLQPVTPTLPAGELAALATAVCWTVTALSFENAGRRIGSLPLNLIRLVLAQLLFVGLQLLRGAPPIPLGAGPRVWGYLMASGLIGFVLGDLFLFEAFVRIGARVSMLVFTLVPPMTAVLGLFLLGERLELLTVLGILVTLSGIVLVVLRRKDSIPAAGPPAVHGLSPARQRATGISFAVLGAFGQALGLVLSRLGAGTDFDPFSASQIRGLTGILGFIVVLAFFPGGFRKVAVGLRDKRALPLMVIGAIFGPFLGVSLGLRATQLTTAAVASTIMGLVPILIVAPSAIINRERLAVRDIIGAMVAVAGTAVLFSG